MIRCEGWVILSRCWVEGRYICRSGYFPNTVKPAIAIRWIWRLFPSHSLSGKHQQQSVTLFDMQMINSNCSSDVIPPEILKFSHNHTNHSHHRYLRYRLTKSLSTYQKERQSAKQMGGGTRVLAARLSRGPEELFIRGRAYTVREQRNFVGVTKQQTSSIWEPQKPLLPFPSEW